MTHCLDISDSEAVLVDGAADNLEAIYDVREEILKAGKRILVDDPDCQLPNEHFERFTDLGLGLRLISRIIRIQFWDTRSLSIFRWYYG